MYRKIPADLMEGTRRGSVLSLIAASVMVVLFLMETAAFFSKGYVYFCCSNPGHLHSLFVRMETSLQLDTNDEPRVRLNFNITMMDLKCEFAVVDVMSVLGTEQNVSSHVTKWHVDAAGVRQR